MKNIVKALILVCALTTLSCAKKTVTPVQIDTQAMKQLQGSWIRMMQAEMDVYENPSDPDTYAGIATAIVSSIITFNPDFTYTFANKQSFKSFVATNPNTSITAEMVQKNVEGEMIIYGTYAANSTVMQITNKSVKLANGVEISAEEYAKYDTSVGTDIIENIWSIEGDTLILSSNVGSKEQQTAEYKRVTE